MHSSKPRRINVCGVWFKIQYVDGLVDDKGVTASGLMCGPTRVISICTAQNDSETLLEATLLHEIVHAILYVTGQTQYLSVVKEEAIVCALETGLGGIYGRRRR